MTRPATYVADAGPKGKGVFAGRPLHKSAVIGSFTGRPRWIWEIPKDVWPYAMQVGYDRYVVPRHGSAVWYMNHSCEPNCYVAGRRIIAARDISKGEELTFDYSSDVDWPGFSMTCSCGAPGCREVIRAYRFLPAELKVSYGGRVAPFIRREYLRERRGSGPGSPAVRRAAPRGS